MFIFIIHLIINQVFLLTNFKFILKINFHLIIIFISIKIIILINLIINPINL